MSRNWFLPQQKEGRSKRKDLTSLKLKRRNRELKILYLSFDFLYSGFQICFNYYDKLTKDSFLETFVSFCVFCSKFANFHWWCVSLSGFPQYSDHFWNKWVFWEFQWAICVIQASSKVTQNVLFVKFCSKYLSNQYSIHSLRCNFQFVWLCWKKNVFLGYVCRCRRGRLIFWRSQRWTYILRFSIFKIIFLQKYRLDFMHQGHFRQVSASKKTFKKVAPVYSLFMVDQPSQKSNDKSLFLEIQCYISFRTISWSFI